MIDNAAFADQLNRDAAAVEGYLTAALDTLCMPPRLCAAMRHGVLGGGKRLRPFLLLETVRSLGGAVDDAVLRAACALEAVHSYSLVHDDLPAMDDDDLRRGQPTVHRAYDEATAILAGDALLTFAFELLADADTPHGAKLVALLAKAAGAGGMVGGQMLDLEAEGRFADGQPLVLDADAIIRLQAMKTGALMMVALEMGAVLGGASAVQADALHRYGKAIGLAFQIADDLLDVEGDAATMGKAARKDTALGKGTLVTLWGVDKARAHCVACVDEAKAALAPFGARAERLAEAAAFIARRNH